MAQTRLALRLCRKLMAKYYREMQKFYDWPNGQTFNAESIASLELAQKRYGNKLVQLQLDDSVTPSISVRPPGSFPTPNYTNPFTVNVTGAIHSNNVPDFDFDWSVIGAAIPISFYEPHYYCPVFTSVIYMAGGYVLEDSACDFYSPVYQHSYGGNKEMTGGIWMTWIPGTWHLYLFSSWYDSGGIGDSVVNVFTSSTDSPRPGSFALSKTLYGTGPITMNATVVSSIT